NDIGEQYDRYTPHLPESGARPGEKWVYDKLQDKMMSKILTGLEAAPKTETPKLPEKDTADGWIEWLRKEVVRLEKEIEEIDRQMNIY
ncbi:hypothetical protein SCB29_38500, partial [Paraburkholderia sp. SIMBA_055]